MFTLLMTRRYPGRAVGALEVITQTDAEATLTKLSYPATLRPHLNTLNADVTQPNLCLYR